MNATHSPSSSSYLSSLENAASHFRLDDTDGHSRFATHRAPTLISRPRLEDGLWRPLRLDLLKAPLTRYRD